MDKFEKRERHNLSSRNVVNSFSSLQREERGLRREREREEGGGGGERWGDEGGGGRGNTLGLTKRSILFGDFVADKDNYDLICSDLI